METFTFRFTPTKNDYAIASREMTLRQTGMRLAIVVVALIPPALTMFHVSLEPFDLVGLICVLFPIWLFLYSLIAYILFVGPFMIARRAEKSKRCTSETILRANDEGVMMKDEFSEWKTDWGSFKKVLETKDYFLLILATNNMGQPLPKRAFESSDQEIAFRKLLNTKGFFKL